MKTLTILLALTFSVMFSSPSFAEWKKVGRNVSGTTYYVDLERIRKHGGYVYFWRIRNYLKPDKWGDLSSKVYNQGDCKLFRYKVLSASFHKEPMGRGTDSAVQMTGESYTPPDKWKYPPPESSIEEILKRVCNR